MNFLDKKSNTLHETKKDPSIELLRIFGCISVIGNHVKINMRYFRKKKRYLQKFSIIFNGCLCADGVPIFWSIMGFFYSKKFHMFQSGEEDPPPTISLSAQKTY